MDILTNSSLSMFRTCPRKFYYRQVLGIALKGNPRQLVLGSAAHLGLEKFYSGASVGDIVASAVEYLQKETDVTGFAQAQYDDLAIDMAIAEGMLRGYATRYADDLERFETILPEVEFCLPIVNPDTGAPSRSFMQAGKADGLVQDKEGRWWLMEFKTASKVDKTYIDRLKLDNQITSYIDGLQRYFAENGQDIKIEGVIYNIIKKPSIRQTQKETLQDYCQRVIFDYQDAEFNPKTGERRIDFYFTRLELFRSQQDFEQYRHELWDTAKDVLEKLRNQRFYRNPAMCGQFNGCAYLPLCVEGQQAMYLYTEKPRHSELSRELVAKVELM